jgi:hypothetical protein
MAYRKRFRGFAIIVKLESIANGVGATEPFHVREAR